MADKRISQLIERTDIANNDVLPIVASGATTTNKVTISTIQEWMQDNIDLGVTSVGITLGSTGTDVNVTGSPITTSGNITINIPTASATNRGLLSAANWTTFNNKVSSVGLSMPSAFAVANSPITGSGTIAVTGAGTVSQYIRGDGSLADFPQGGGGGGSSVSYYLNGSVSQGTIGGIGYYEMNKVPVLGTGTDFVAIADGYLASFITDAGDPSLLLIPAGNWNFETYFSASSSGGTPTFYIELYKVNSGGTATLIASNSANPELIAFGTTINPYFSALAVPTTTLLITDRLALRYYVARSGRTITLHTENGHLCQIITTFTTGLTALNGLTAQVQNFATGTSGTDFAISSSVSTHTFNLPDASATARGVVTTGIQTIAGIKNFTSTIRSAVSLEMAGTGTALPTELKNINGPGLSSSGSNGIGFNSSNNLYFAGSEKGCAVISMTNTGTRTYTLQDASGTLAFTSDISTALTGYVTLGTAQTITGAKTFDTTTSTFALMNSTNANGGVLSFRRNGTNVGHIGNSAQLGGGILDAIEVRSGIGSSVILRSDGGQFTLASSGAVTLTGALNGTSASFTGAVSTGRLTSTGDYVSFGNNGYIRNDSAGWLQLQGGSNGTRIMNAGNSSAYLSISETTGAATFSSSVTANRFNVTGVGNPVAFDTLGVAGSVKLSAKNDFEFSLLNERGTTSEIIVGNSNIDLRTDNQVRLRVTPLGNVGIGTATPETILHAARANSGGQTILYVDNNAGSALNNEAVLKFSVDNGASPTNGGAGISAINVSAGSGATDLRMLTFGTGGYLERMRITSTGNVGIGTATPSSILDVVGSGGIRINEDGAGTKVISIRSNFAGVDPAINVSTNNALLLQTNNTERMRITSGGDVLLGSATITSLNTGWYFGKSAGLVTQAFAYSSGTAVIQEFYRQSGGQVGSISYNGTVTLYNSTSDYRLKEDLKDYNGLEIVSKLKTYDFNWKGADTRDYGMIAHELQEVLPSYVNGEKDALDNDGNIKPQGVDYSKIVPILIKAIQELKTEIDSLKNQIK